MKLYFLRFWQFAKNTTYIVFFTTEIQYIPFIVKYEFKSFFANIPAQMPESFLCENIYALIITTFYTNHLITKYTCIFPIFANQKPSKFLVFSHQLREFLLD